MRRLLAIIPMAIVLALVLSAAVAFSTELIVTGEITDVVQAPDKNGDMYTRLIVKFNRELNGTEYEVGLPVMAFQPLAAAGAEKQIGDTLNAICQKREYQGRESYTVIKFLE